jgi:tetratricopeptide (TPR) repeat protein
MNLTIDQQQQLENLGLNPTPTPQTLPKINLFPLFSISGLTLLSIGGLILLKSKNTSYGQIPISAPSSSSQNQPSPTQVPKSIQHYLLASQQAFSSALQAQSLTTSPSPSNKNASNATSNNVISYLNQSIIDATAAIKEFPNDYRGFEQRGKIYLSLLDSQPQFLSAAISDYQQAQKLNSSSADLTRQLASLYARKGDLQNTLNYLSETVSLEPTKAQNFYDLAKLQQQAGLLPDALNTYNELLPLISDPSQKTQVEAEKTTLEKIIAQNNLVSPKTSNSESGSPTPQITPILDGNFLQASILSSPIIATPQISPNISLNNQTDSNSLSGTALLPSGQKQLTLQNSKLTSTSQIYLTILTGGKNQSLEVLSKSKNSFIVGFQSPLSEDVTFKWWIVN